VGDSRSPGGGCPSYLRYRDVQRQPQEGSVPDRRRRIVPEVVLVRRGVFGVRGIWKGGKGGEGWVKRGQFTSNLRPRWTDPVTARRVPSK
jgi:hypothetical protein